MDDRGITEDQILRALLNRVNEMQVEEVQRNRRQRVFDILLTALIVLCTVTTLVTLQVTRHVMDGEAQVQTELGN